jgi:hypothetical protein
LEERYRKKKQVGGGGTEVKKNTVGEGVTFIYKNIFIIIKKKRGE